MTSNDRVTFDRLLPQFLDTVVIAWLDGTVTSLTGHWATKLPGPENGVIHVITAANPNGDDTDRTEGDSANERRHAELLLAVKDLTRDHDSQPWSWPAVGTSPDGRHAELSVVLSGLDRATAVELARRFDQLAIFELTAETLAVVSCIDAADPVEVSRRSLNLSIRDLTSAQLDRWWSAHTVAAALAGVDLPTLQACAQCGSHRLGRVLYGMPMGPPPPWITLGGCIVGSR